MRSKIVLVLSEAVLVLEYGRNFNAKIVKGFARGAKTGLPLREIFSREDAKRSKTWVDFEDEDEDDDDDDGKKVKLVVSPEPCVLCNRTQFIVHAIIEF